MTFEFVRALNELLQPLVAGNLHFLQDGPAETANYMIAGFVVIFGIMGLYLISLIVRTRNLSQDLDTLQEIEHQAD